MTEIQTQSPTRVDLAGGTLDCWPLYLFLQNPVTVNVAIDIFTYCRLTPRDDRQIELISDDLKKSKTYADLAACLQDPDADFALYRAHLQYWRPEQGFRLQTKSESPVGGGLGGSSSLCISILKAFCEWRKTKIDPYEMVRIASHLEAQVLLKPTGTQDYFPPLFGGLNFITYGVEGPRVRVTEIPKEVFHDRFLLVYTGRSHHSGINNWQVIKSYLDGDEKTRKNMARLAEISKLMKEAFDHQAWSELPRIFSQEYAARTELSNGFSSPEIRTLKELANSVGAEAKICGAGGGGCVLIWCQDRGIEKARELCRKSGFTVLPTQPWQNARQ